MTTKMRRAYEAFGETGLMPSGVRGVVADSWLRSAAAGVDPDANLAPVVIDRGDLDDYRGEHPLSPVLPLLHDVLGRAAEDCDCVMAIGDAQGRLLWVCGRPQVLRRAEAINFVEGSAWDEPRAGTNAPGMALALDEAVLVHADEHFARSVQRWSCAAAPIHDPSTHELLGLLDVTGGPDVASPQTLALVRAAARMTESELARLALGRPQARRLDLNTDTRVLEVDALGRSECIVHCNGRAHRLSPRHSDIMVALAEAPDGLSAEELEAEVYPSGVQSSTVRAELVRLRSLLGSDVLGSRPYRLTYEVRADWRQVAAQVAARQAGEALRTYSGPLLPHSEAPGVVRRRAELEYDLRAAVLGSGRTDLMVAWTRSRWGAEDLPMWQRQQSVLPADSPLRPAVDAAVVRLERELRAP